MAWIRLVIGRIGMLPLRSAIYEILSDLVEIYMRRNVDRKEASVCAFKAAPKWNESSDQ